MTDKEKIIDILLEFYEEYQGNIPNRPMIPRIYANEIIDSLQEEPVSEKLDRAAEKYAYELFPSIGAANTETELAFKAGAKWQKQQTISKAVEWLQRNIDSRDWLMEFRKVLEE